MGGKTLQDKENRFNAGIKIIKTRLDNYEKGTDDLQKALQSHFFDAPDARQLKETPVHYAEFNWDEIKKKLPLLINKQVITQALEQMQQNDEEATCFTVLDAIIQENDLPFIYDQQTKQYLFITTKHYTPIVLALMHQFSHMLSIYALYLSLLHTYKVIYQIQSLISPNEKEQELIHAVNVQIAKAATNKVKVKTTIAQAGELDNNLCNQLNELNEQYQPLIESALEQAEQAKNLFECCIDKIEDFYRKYPNETKIWWLFKDNAWQLLLKTVCTSLLSTQYFTYNSKQSTLNISRDLFNNAITKEFEQLKLAARSDGLGFHVELLQDELKKVRDLDAEARGQAVFQGCKLKELMPRRAATAQFPSFFNNRNQRPIVWSSSFGDPSMQTDQLSYQ